MRLCGTNFTGSSSSVIHQDVLSQSRVHKISPSPPISGSNPNLADFVLSGRLARSGRTYAIPAHFSNPTRLFTPTSFIFSLTRFINKASQSRSFIILLLTRLVSRIQIENFLDQPIYNRTWYQRLSLLLLHRVQYLRSDVRLYNSDRFIHHLRFQLTAWKRCDR